MASLLNTLKFIMTYFRVVSKYTLFLISTSWIIYLTDIKGDLYYFLSANVFFVNIVLIYFLTKGDKYLEKNRFYLLFNISDVNRFFSKSILFGIPFLMHFSLFLLVVIGIDYLLYLTLFSILIVIFSGRLILFNNVSKLISGIYIPAFTGLLLSAYFVSGVLTMIILSGLVVLSLVFIISRSLQLNKND